MAIWMNGLRVYVNDSVSEQSGPRVFYSRRANGPYYLWRFEERVGQWCFSRMPRADFAPKPLSLTSWKTVPAALQAKLGEHYLE